MTSAMRAGPLAIELPQWTFADRMRKIRRDIVQIDQTEFAQKLGVTRQAYAAWESGRNEPRSILAIAKKVELISGVPAVWVLGIDAPHPITEVRTPEYLPASSDAAPVLTLVRDPASTYPGVGDSYGSSPTPRGYSTGQDVPRSARTVNNADAA